VLDEAQRQRQRAERNDEVESHVVREPLNKGRRLDDPVARIDFRCIVVVMMVMMIVVVVVMMVVMVVHG